MMMMVMLLMMIIIIIIVNDDINALWSRTSSGCNIQYDQYRNTKQVLSAIQNDNEDRIHHELKSQGFVISSILLSRQ